ncbi:MAG: DUF1788 domain-containing protein [Gracilimonas sp.]|uniref:BREX protein BrxB domain-containing protein n=1 Tax=Gracilimonas sp. TaxID=1974203 RepID=UPI003750D4C7|nr:DUF1788 domain-containing protein [Gracilimonas sp.]
MILDNLIEFLKKDSFQDTEAGLLSFPAYAYTYDPVKEYEMRSELPSLKSRLNRPNSWQECLILNIYDEMIEHLESRKFGDESMWQLLLEAEKDNPEKVRRDIIRHLHSDEFIEHISAKVGDHLDYDSEKKKSYVFVHGWGSIFPFLRAHTFLNRMEDRIKGYKMILLYPGKYENSYYVMFGELESDTIYRASCLNQLIGD